MLIERVLHNMMLSSNAICMGPFAAPEVMLAGTQVRHQRLLGGLDKHNSDR